MHDRGQSGAWLVALRGQGGCAVRRRRGHAARAAGPPPADLHAALLDAQHQRTSWQALAGAGGRPEIPVDLDRAHAAYASLAEELTWLGERLAPTPAGGDLLTTPLPELRTRMAALAGAPERLAVVPRVLGALDALRGGGEAPLPPVVPVDRTGPLPLSFAQERMWFLERLELAAGVYNMPARIRLRGRVDAEALRREATSVFTATTTAPSSAPTRAEAAVLTS